MRREGERIDGEGIASSITVPGVVGGSGVIGGSGVAGGSGVPGDSSAGLSRYSSLTAAASTNDDLRARFSVNGTVEVVTLVKDSVSPKPNIGLRTDTSVVIVVTVPGRRSRGSVVLFSGRYDRSTGSGNCAFRVLNSVFVVVVPSFAILIVTIMMFVMTESGGRAWRVRLKGFMAAQFSSNRSEKSIDQRCFTGLHLYRWVSCAALKNEVS